MTQTAPPTYADLPLYSAVRQSIRTGDLLLFDGRSGVSGLIKVFSPQYSHVGMAHVIDDGGVDRLKIVESTTMNSVPDIRTGRPATGVAERYLSETLAAYRGRAWWAPVVPALEDWEIEIVEMFWGRVFGRPYDAVGAIGAGVDGPGWLTRLVSRLPWFPFLNRERSKAYFCSHLAASAYREIRRLSLNLQPSELTPADMAGLDFIGEPMRIL
jgi:hypothetical protein